MRFSSEGQSIFLIWKRLFFTNTKVPRNVESLKRIFDKGLGGFSTVTLFWLTPTKKPCNSTLQGFSTRGGTWTRTPQRAQDFKSGVSTNSTPRASSDLSYFVWKNSAFWRLFWAGDGIPTRDPNLGKVVLYQLSYSRLYFYYTTFDYAAGDKFINILWFFSREWHNISHKLAIIWAYNWLFLFDIWHK